MGSTVLVTQVRASDEMAKTGARFRSGSRTRDIDLFYMLIYVIGAANLFR
jgi:hypothetical protein